MTAVTLLSQKKQKEKIWWWPFLGKPKAKEAGGLKFGNLGLMFFSSLSILVVIQHYFMCYGQFLQKIGQHLEFSPQKPELVNQCNPFVLLFDTFVCIECCEARNHCFSTLRTGLSGRP